MKQYLKDAANWLYGLPRNIDPILELHSLGIHAIFRHRDGRIVKCLVPWDEIESAKVNPIIIQLEKLKAQLA